MKTKHTPEPWTFFSTHAARNIYGAVADCEKAFVASFAIHDKRDEANVDRAIACVNACAGIEDPAAYIEAMRRELRRLVDLCDAEATMFDGSNPDTRAAHELLGDFNKPADEDDGGWRY